MKKTILMLLFLSFVTVSTAQNSKFYSTAEIDFVFPKNLDYDYSGVGRGGSNTDITKSGFLLTSFGAQYTYNYLLFSKFSVGALGGFQTFSDPDFSMLKIGGIMKFFFVDVDNVYTYIQVARAISLNKDQFKDGTGGRFGIGFPVLKWDNLAINTNVFVEHTQLDLEGAKPLLNYINEKPSNLSYRKTLGISFGVQF
jgi:hypothetical protein